MSTVKEMEGSSLSGGSVRKGAWTKTEDELLKACIHKYGEGKWHLVPQRAGLNRCRKSCRLRWLNYLKPDIKRGDFSEDEVDLIIRMHKLFGNRWSLIAGRIPGRTSNDVKNYWNTYMRRKLLSRNKRKKLIEEKETEPHEVIKPQPQYFTKESTRLPGKKFNNVTYQSSYDSKIDDTINGAVGATSSESSKNWWETLLEDNAGDRNNNIFSLGREWNGFWNEHFTSISINNPCDFLAEHKTLSDDNLNFWDIEFPG